MPQNALYDMGNINVELLPTLITVTCNKAYYANPVGSYRVQIYGGSNLTTLVSQKTSSTNKITFTATDGIVKNTKYKIVARAYQNANAGGDYGGSVTGTATTPTVGGGTHPKATKKVTQKFTNPKLVSPSISDNTASGHVGSAINNSLNNKSKTATKTKISNTQVQETPAKEVAEGVQNSSFEFKKGSSVRSVGNSSIQRGTLTLDTKNKKPNESTVATKDTDIDITGSYYAFGAGIFFGSDLDGVKSSGGLGVFTDASGMNGYFIKLESTDVVGGDKKQLRLLKANSGNLRRIDTEVGTKELALVYGATLYRLDVFIKVGTTSNEVFISVNGNPISYTDTNISNTDDPFKKKIDPTKYITLFCNLGQVQFDYVYATPITQADYDNKINKIKYQGQTGEATLSSLFGERIISNFSKLNLPNGYLEEFGPTAREIVRTNIKYDNRPGFPLRVNTGINPYVQVIGSKMNSFGADVYVLNNAGTFMPLAGGPYSYSIWGNYISEPGVHEYSENLYDINTYTAPDPVTFESIWIQNEADAKSLASFIKNQWSKQQFTIQIEVFGNPLVTPGEIITINYPKQNLTGTEKFLVTDVSLSFGEETSTRISARSIYS